MLRIPILVLAAIPCLVLVIPSCAQLPLTVEDASRVTPLFETPSRNSLKCALDQWSPELDFDFRFVTGFVVRCRLGLFEGKRAAVTTYIRVTPKGRAPSLFASAYRVPEAAPETRAITGGKPDKLKNEIGMSGVFCVGEGSYAVEVLVKDDQGRTYRRKWSLRVAPRGSERDVQLAIEPLAVESVDQRAWQTVASQKGGRLRLTILLDAAPINPFQSRLRAWDRAFLLECIYSLLRQTPHQSVRLVAFNLDQQREIFRSNRFDSAAFVGLSQTLAEIETATVSVQALKQRNSPLFLASLANGELAAADRSDVVIFLGPNGRMDANIGRHILTADSPTNPPFFYFEYFPWPGAGFPDAIQRLTRVAEGKTFQIHSPAQFDQAIQKMLAQLKQE